MEEVKFPVEMFQEALGINKRIMDVYMDAYMTEITVVYDPDNDGQPQTRTY